MLWFKCSIVGENFPGELIGSQKRIGFFTTRFVQAKSPEDAEKAALEALKREDALLLPKGAERPVDSKVYFEEIVEISKDEVNPPPGFVWYEMET